MNTSVVNIVNRQSLVNGYVHLTLATPSVIQMLPGQFVIIENTTPCYILEQKAHNVELIVFPTLAQKLQDNATLLLSDIQGVPLPIPQKKAYYLMSVQPDALNACLFFLKKYRHSFNGLIFIGTNESFPFAPCPSRRLIAGVPNDVIAAIPLLEDWNIPHRLCSLKECPGVFQGTVEELSSRWLQFTHHSGSIEQIIISSL